MIITSFSNQKVKFIRKLEQRKYRQEAQQYFIEGLRTVGEAVQTGAPLETLVIAPDLLVSDFGQSLLGLPGVKDVPKLTVSPEIYEKLSHKQGPQGIGAVVRQVWHALPAVQVQHEDVWVALDAVADPGNLGTIMRTAEAVGCRGIILLGSSTDPYDPRAVKASMGAIFSLSLVQAEWAEFLRWARANHLKLVGTSDRAKRDYQDMAYSSPLALLMGSERHGLDQTRIAACNTMVRIPMKGRSDSLNLAVATGVLLYEIYNQSRVSDIIES